jgi:hypothetical protein
MTARDGAMWAAMFGVIFGGCRPSPPKPVEVKDIQFPVLVLFSNSGASVYDRSEDLHVMHVNRVNLSDQPPTLIDSGFAIYTMEQLRSIHGGLWLMAHPSGTTDVTFELKRATESGKDAALRLVRQQLDKQTWRSDLERQRKLLEEQLTITAMANVLQQSAD